MGSFVRTFYVSKFGEENACVKVFCRNKNLNSNIIFDSCQNLKSQLHQPYNLVT